MPFTRNKLCMITLEYEQPVRGFDRRIQCRVLTARFSPSYFLETKQVDKITAESVF